MSKQEIIEKLDSILSEDSFTPDQQKLNELRSEFSKLREADEKQQKDAHAADESVDEEFEYTESDEDIRFKELLNTYFEKKKQFDKAKNEALESNYKEKKLLTEELQELIQDEENIGKAYARFNAIKQKWSEIGHVTSSKRREIQAEYSRLIELFYYNINIYRELQQHDLKKNQELKVEVIEKIKALDKEKSMNQLDFLIHKYLDEWDQIGPTFKEEWEKIREEYREAVNSVFERIREHRKSVKDAHKQNFEKKKELIEKASEVIKKDLSEMKVVQSMTKELIDLQKEWKQIGFAGRKYNDEVWKEFRGLCDDFFEKRAEFLKVSNEQFAEIKQKKKELIDKAKEIYDGDDAEKIANQLKTLQREWKNVGTLLPQEEYKLFKEFRGYCDTFFNRKKQQAKDLEKELKANLHKKEELLVEFAKDIEKKLEDKGEDLVEELKDTWEDVGDVPSKFASKIEGSFSSLVSKAYDGLGITKADIAEKEFKSKIDRLSNKEDASQDLQNERRRLQAKIKEAESAVLQLEDKMAFFKYSDESNPLKKELIDRIDAAKVEVENWRKKRKQVDLMIKEAKNKQESAQETTEEGESSESNETEASQE